MRWQLVSRVQAYFMSIKKYEDEIIRAVKMFTDARNLKETIKSLLVMDDEMHSLFTDWFVFDFKTSAGKTPLEIFYHKNLGILLPGEREVIKNMMEYSEFGIFEYVTRREERLRFKNLVKGERMWAIFEDVFVDFRKGEVVAGRIIKEDNQYVLLGNPLVFFEDSSHPVVKKFLEEEEKNAKTLAKLREEHGPPLLLEGEILEEGKCICGRCGRIEEIGGITIERDGSVVILCRKCYSEKMRE